MATRSQRHLREIYGIDSAGESDTPADPGVTMEDSELLGPLAGPIWTVNNTGTVSGGVIDATADFTQIGNYRVHGVEPDTLYNVVMDGAGLSSVGTVRITLGSPSAGANVANGATNFQITSGLASPATDAPFIFNDGQAHQAPWSITGAITITKV